MCGIAGFTGAEDPGTLERMVARMQSRGPDAKGFCHRDGVNLGHARLSILDHVDGAQPMSTRDGQLTIVFNGEVYNHHELRKELEDLGHLFESDHSDTEVLLHGYREWGRSLVDRLNGMWAFAIHDIRRRELFLSRDRFGQKPLYYYRQGELLIFASELSALIEHNLVPRNISTRSLAKLFGYCFIPAPLTLYERVAKLPAGHNLVFRIDSGEIEIRKYWDYVIEPFENVPQTPEEEWGEEIRRLLKQAVKRRMEADVPLGIFLSGGIDSTAIAAFAARHVDCPTNLRTFSIGFREKSFDESDYAQLAATALGSSHHCSTFESDALHARIDSTIAALDEPMGDSSLLPTASLCQETRKHVTVALGGDGGDELFAGYDPFRALAPADIYQKLLPGPVHDAIRLVAGLLPVSPRNLSLDFKIKKTLQGLSHSPALWNPVWLGSLEVADMQELFGAPIDAEDVYSEAIEAWESCNADSLVDKTSQFYIKLYLQDDILTKIDRASMMHSLEVRSPFLDIDFVNFARRIPSAWKLRKGATKYILKKALEPILPHDIVHRPKKGFGIPVAQWFCDWDFDLSLPSVLDEDFIKKRIELHQRGKLDDRLFLWNAVVMDKWLASR